jgi:hypothetical protein
VIGDYQVGIFEAAAGLPVEALVVIRAPAAAAIAMLAFDRIPDIAPRDARYARKRAVFCFERPLPNLPEIGICLLEKITGIIESVFEPPLAYIIASSLGQHGPEAAFHSTGKQRYILIDKLFLEVDSMGTDDDLAAAADGKIYRRNEICKAFSGSGAGFHGQVTACAILTWSGRSSNRLDTSERGPPEVKNASISIRVLPSESNFKPIFRYNVDIKARKKAGIFWIPALLRQFRKFY